MPQTSKKFKKENILHHISWVFLGGRWVTANTYKFTEKWKVEESIATYLISHESLNRYLYITFLSLGVSLLYYLIGLLIDIWYFTLCLFGEKRLIKRLL